MRSTVAWPGVSGVVGNSASSQSGMPLPVE
jgi:hypothetical protein